VRSRGAPRQRALWRYWRRRTAGWIREASRKLADYRLVKVRRIVWTKVHLNTNPRGK
jgi:hypothetical protein